MSGLPRMSRTVAASCRQPGAVAVPAEGCRAAVAQPLERYEREGAPPDARRGQADADRRRLGDAEGVVGREQDQVRDQDQCARRVTEGPAAGRDRVALLGRGDLRQVGVVEDHRHGQRGVGDDQQQAAEQIAVAVQEEHARGGRGAQVGGDREERLLAARAVGGRARQRHHEDRQDDGRRDRSTRRRSRRRIGIPSGCTNPSASAAALATDVR